MKFWSISIAVVVVGLLSVTFYLWPRISNEEQWDHVRNAKISEFKLKILNEDNLPVSSISIGNSKKYIVDISGQFSGPENWEFDRFVRINHLFTLKLTKGEQIAWLTSPGTIDLPDDGFFAFKCVMMLPSSLPPSEYRLSCAYYGKDLDSIPIKVVP